MSPPFIPLLASAIPPEFTAVPAVTFTVMGRRSGTISVDDRIRLYQLWKDGLLEPNPAAPDKFLLDVEIEDDDEPYHYYYPIDTGYLLSVQWRRDNLSSRMGLFRWIVEMEAALRMNAIDGYENATLGGWDLANAFRMISKLENGGSGYGSINIPMAGALRLYTFLHHLIINDEIGSVTGNEHQLALAEKVGISNLQKLFTALSNLTGPGGGSWAEILGYNIVELTATKVESLLNELNGNWQKYKGNEHQLALAKKIGISNLGQLFSALSNLTGPGGGSWAKILGYNKIGLSAAKVESLLNELNGNWQKYKGNEHQLALAEKVGISNLRQLFSALSSFKGPGGKSWAKLLGYNLIDLPAAKIAPLLNELEKNWKVYRGNERQIALAEKIGISHLKHLFSALSNLAANDGNSWAEILGYRKIGLNIDKVTLLLDELNKNWRTYKGNERQAALAEKIGISHLGDLFSALSSFSGPRGKSWAEVLGYNRISLPLARISDFFTEFVHLFEMHSIPIQRLASELSHVSPREAHRKFLEIKERVDTLHDYLSRIRRDDWPATFYDYLLKTLPFLPVSESFIAIAAKIIGYIESNQEMIERVVSDERIPITYAAFHRHFGEFTFPIIKFYGGQRGIESKRRGGLKEFPFPELPLTHIDRSVYARGNFRSPLEALLIKEERLQIAALREALDVLLPAERMIIERMFSNDEEASEVAASLGMELAKFQREVERIYSFLRRLIENDGRGGNRSGTPPSATPAATPSPVPQVPPAPAAPTNASPEASSSEPPSVTGLADTGETSGGQYIGYGTYGIEATARQTQRSAAQVHAQRRIATQQVQPVRVQTPIAAPVRPSVLAVH